MKAGSKFYCRKTTLLTFASTGPFVKFNGILVFHSYQNPEIPRRLIVQFAVESFILLFLQRVSKACYVRSSKRDYDYTNAITVSMSGS